MVVVLQRVHKPTLSIPYDKPFLYVIRYSHFIVCILRQVTNTQTCGQSQQQAMAEISSPFAITSLPTHHSAMV